MNILEVLKEKKQILKVSAIALIGAAAVYMSPAHMSSAMVNGGDDGKPIESSQVGKEDTDNVDQSTSAVEGDTNIQEPAIESEGLSFDAVEGDSDVKIQEDISSTKAKEIEIGLKLIGSLPTDEEGLKDFLLLPSKEEIDRHKETYEKIQVVVDKLVKSADEDKSDNSRQMKIANAIYCWVANNIKYIHDGEKDAFEVFESGCGVCREYSRLTNLMMCMAGIPSLRISTLFDKSEHIDHVFNAVYIDEGNPERRGWTLIDTTWAIPKVIRDGVYEQSFFEKDKIDSADGIDAHFVEVINDANDEYVYSYGFDIKDALKDIIAKYMHDDISTHIERINKDISCSLREINSKVGYESIEKFLEIKIEVGSDDKATLEEVLSNLKLVFRISKDAEKRIDGKNQERFCEYFPAFYNLGMSFKEANRQILSMEDHSVKSLYRIINISSADDKYSIVTENGLTYLLSGDEGEAGIFLYGNPNCPPLENVEIPEEVLSYGIPIKIGDGIKSLILKGDEEVDISDARDLEIVNTDKSRKYVCEQGALFERASMDKWQLLHGMIYKEVKKEDGSIRLRVCGRSRCAAIKIPEVLLTKYRDSVIEIYAGIETLILQGDEKIDIRIAWGLKNIDTTRSSRYIAEDGFLYERKDGEKGEVVGIFDTHRQVGDIGYIICESDDQKKVEKIIVDIYKKILDLEALPPEITKYNVPIEIRSGVRSLKIKGDEEVELTCPDIEEVDVSESNKYIVEDGVLYAKDAAGNKGAQIVVFKRK